MEEAGLGPENRFLRDSMGPGPHEDCKELMDGILDVQRGLNAGESRTEEWGRIEDGPRLRMSGAGWLVTAEADYLSRSGMHIPQMLGTSDSGSDGAAGPASQGPSFPSSSLQQGVAGTPSGASASSSSSFSSSKAPPAAIAA